MRRLAAALMISWGAFSAPGQASDDLSPSATALAPVDNATLAMMTGGTAVALQLGAAAEAGTRAVDLSATVPPGVNLPFLGPFGGRPDDRRHLPRRGFRRHGRHDLVPAFHRL